MKRMKEIMEGSEDPMNSRIHTEGFEDGNLQKGHSHHQFDAPQNMHHIKMNLDRDVENLDTRSDLFSDEDE